jgi:hypothetical protein
MIRVLFPLLVEVSDALVDMGKRKNLPPRTATYAYPFARRDCQINVLQGAAAAVVIYGNFLELHGAACRPL